jgi:hypothetical protein
VGSFLVRKAVPARIALSLIRDADGVEGPVCHPRCRAWRAAFRDQTRLTGSSRSDAVNSDQQSANFVASWVKSAGFCFAMDDPVRGRRTTLLRSGGYRFAVTRDLITSCDCPDFSNPCKHIAAVYYLLAEQFDRDPFLLFRLRGMERKQFVAMLSKSEGSRTRRTAGDVSESEQVRETRAPSSNPEVFWRGRTFHDDHFGQVALSGEAAVLARDRFRHLGRGCRYYGWRQRSYRDGRKPDRPFRRLLRRIHERAWPLELLHHRRIRLAQLERTRTRTASAAGPCRGRSPRSQSLSLPCNQAMGTRSTSTLVAWSESSSPNWLSRVLARFPDQAQNALIKMVWLERAKQRALQNPVDTGSAPLVAGVDVGGGEAETVVYVC